VAIVSEGSVVVGVVGWAMAWMIEHLRRTLRAVADAP
jgi:hypothetical protein